jgi:hypothetical protein
MRVEKGLLGSTAIGSVEGRATGHAEDEDLERDPLAAEVGHGLVPVDLSLNVSGIALGHEGLALAQVENRFPLSDVAPHRRLGDGQSGNSSWIRW